MQNTKVRIYIDTAHSGKEVEALLTNKDCESIYAMCHGPLARSIGPIVDDVKTSMNIILSNLPKDYDFVFNITFPLVDAANILAMCLVAISIKPQGPHIDWIEPIRSSIEAAIRNAKANVRVSISDNIVFDTFECTSPKAKIVLGEEGKSYLAFLGKGVLEGIEEKIAKGTAKIEDASHLLKLREQFKNLGDIENVRRCDDLISKLNSFR